jgi:hypothetical protein
MLKLGGAAMPRWIELQPRWKETNPVVLLLDVESTAVPEG